MTHSASRTDEIILTALQLAEDRGVSGVTTATLARRLGFTEAALYRYFPGKGAILAAVLQHVAERIFVSMSTDLQPMEPSSPEDVERQLGRHIDEFTRHRGLALELLLAAASGRDAALRESASAFLHEYVQRMETHFDQLRESEKVWCAPDADELARMWVCQLLGGFVRCRISHDPWSPTGQPGFVSFVRYLTAGAAAQPVVSAVGG
ncbi:MAG: TetR/AcrR family transcriptional regulator [Acidobacteriota bacterium]